MSSGASTILFSSVRAYFTSLHDGNVRRLVLVQFRRIDIDVHDLAVLAEFVHLARHAIVEPHAEGDQQIGLIDGVIRIHRAVHAEHVERERVVAGKRAEAHHGHRDGDAGLLGERAQLFARFAADDAAAGVNHRPLGQLDRRGDLANLLRLRPRVFHSEAGQVGRGVVVGHRLCRAARLSECR